MDWKVEEEEVEEDHEVAVVVRRRRKCHPAGNPRTNPNATNTSMSTGPPWVTSGAARPRPGFLNPGFRESPPSPPGTGTLCGVVGGIGGQPGTRGLANPGLSLDRLTVSGSWSAAMMDIVKFIGTQLS